MEIFKNRKGMVHSREELMFANNYIALEGIIGCGKSTLTKKLSECLNLMPAFEPVGENPYLSAFYKDMSKYGAMMQIWLLNARFRQHKNLVAKISSGEVKGVIQDRTIWADTVFCKMLHEGGYISKEDYNTYLDLFDNMVIQGLVYPQLIVYLRCSPETAYKRIASRGRDCEKGMTLEYLASLNKNYEAFISAISKTGVKVLELDYNKFVDLTEVVRQVKETLPPANPYTKWVRPMRKSTSI